MSALVALFYYVLLPVMSLVVTIFWIKGAKSRRHKQMALLACTVWFLWLIWNLVGVEKILMDKKVDRLCAKDGGVKVYEMVTLSSDMFDKYRYIDIPPKRKIKPEDEYYYTRETKYLIEGNPSMWRSHHRIYRKSDKKLLGESIRYARRGGDLPGPWHKSFYGCPNISKENKQIEKLIFINEEQK